MYCLELLVDILMDSKTYLTLNNMNSSSYVKPLYLSFGYLTKQELTDNPCEHPDRRRYSSLLLCKFLIGGLGKYSNCHQKVSLKTIINISNSKNLSMLK